jgi:hypothetical protein
MNTVLHPEVDGLDVAQCGQAIERVCNSQEIRRAARLRDFLHYVAQRTFDNPGSPVSEQEIGVKVFGRPPDYDTSIDNIVRVNASELRKRIAAYFAAEGAHEPIWFEIPRGSYAPRFMPRPVADASPLAAQRPLEALTAASTSGSGGHRSVALVATLLLLLVALTGVSIWLALDLRAARRAVDPWRSEPTLNALWSPLLDGQRITDVVLADTSFELAEDVLGHRVPLKDYLNRSYVDELNHADLPGPIREEMAIVVTRSDGSFGDFGVATRILALGPNLDHLRMDYARTLRPRALKTDNLVIIGSSYSNPWASLFDSRLNFLVKAGANRQQMFVENTHPLAGEESTYAAPTDSLDSIGYSVVASLPGEDNQGEVLLIEGTTAEATEAAGEFVTSEARLKQLQSLLHTKRLGHFEVLLRTTKLAGTPLSAEIVRYRQH